VEAVVWVFFLVLFTEKNKGERVGGARMGEEEESSRVRGDGVVVALPG
jgi:hypothetical protein